VAVAVARPVVHVHGLVGHAPLASSMYWTEPAVVLMLVAQFTSAEVWDMSVT
jgi:hypothetical protein